MARRETAQGDNHDATFNDRILEMFQKIRGLGRYLLADRVQRGDLFQDDVDGITLRAAGNALPQYDPARGRVSTFFGKAIRFEAKGVIRDLTNRPKSVASGRWPKKSYPPVVSLEDPQRRGSKRTIGDGIRDPRQPIEERVIQRERTQTILSFLNTLPELQRNVVMLHHMEGLEEREIARLLKIPKPEVHSALTGAMKKIRRGIPEE